MRNEEKTLAIIANLSGAASEEAGAALAASKKEETDAIEEERTFRLADLLGH